MRSLSLRLAPCQLFATFAASFLSPAMTVSAVANNFFCADSSSFHCCHACWFFGALSDKAAARMLQTISKGAASVVVVAPRSDRAIAAHELATFASCAIAEASCGRALDRVLKTDCDLTLVCGSIYLVGEVRMELRRRYGVPAPAVSVPIGR